MKVYRKNIIRKIQDPMLWPDFNNSHFLSQLHDAANEAYDKGTIEGYLAALLIYHQICEKIVKLLAEFSVFYIQCKVFPWKYDPEIDNDRQTFGIQLRQLSRGVLSKKIEQFIDKCRDLNKVRNNITHKIVKKGSIRSIKQEAKKSQTLFNNIFDLYVEIVLDYQESLNKYKKNIKKLEKLI